MRVSGLIAMCVFLAAGTPVGAATLEGTFRGTNTCKLQQFTSGGTSTFIVDARNRVRLIEVHAGKSVASVIHYFGTYNPTTRTFRLPTYKFAYQTGGVLTGPVVGKLSADGKKVSYRWEGFDCTPFQGVRLGPRD